MKSNGCYTVVLINFSTLLIKLTHYLACRHCGISSPRPSGRGWIKNGKALAKTTCAVYYSCCDISAKALTSVTLVPDLKVNVI
jgi:hypothetical protein